MTSKRKPEKPKTPTTQRKTTPKKHDNTQNTKESEANGSGHKVSSAEYEDAAKKKAEEEEKLKEEEKRKIKLVSGDCCL